MSSGKEGLPEQQVIDRAMELYGHEDAQRIFQAMLDTLVVANDAIEPVAPLSVFRLAFADIPSEENGLRMPRVIGQHDKFAGFSLALDQRDKAGVLYDLPFTVCNEYALMARYQHCLRRGEIAADTSYNTFQWLIAVGVSISAETELIGRHTGLEDGEYAWYGTSEELLRKYARLWMDDSSSVGETVSDLLTFLRGTPELPRLGYKVGHYLVERVASQGYSLSELVQMPTAVYHDKLTQEFGTGSA